MIERIKSTEYFKPIWNDLDTLLDPKTFVGRAPQQTEKFVKNDVANALKPFEKYITTENVALKV